ncbi:hypothetical protein GCM10027191_09230 [Novilysobacter erysipheiresistens]
MAEYRYNQEDRIGQLRDLEVALAALIPLARRLNLRHLPQYEGALECTRTLLAHGFTQAELSDLARQVPDVWVRHKDWLPPLEKRPDGTWQEPPWFPELEAKLRPALSAAWMLSMVGYY